MRCITTGRALRAAIGRGAARSMPDVALPFAARAGMLASAVATAFSDTRPSQRVLLATLAASLALTATSRAGNVYYVNTSADPGPPGTLSLRQAVALSAQDGGAGNGILFDASLVGSTVTLTQGAISITSPISINGFSAPGMLTISGQSDDRIFYASSTSSLIVARLTLTQGHTLGCGGAIYARNSKMLLLETVVSGNDAAFGGGVCVVGAQSDVSVVRSRISGNSAALGGAMYWGQSGYNSSINNSSFVGNSARQAGGGLYVAGIEGLSIYRSVIAGNSVPAPTQYSYSSQGGGIVIAGVGAGGFSIRATTISGNQAYGAGSAIRILDASGDRTQLFNVTIAGNVSAVGGAISSTGGTPVIDSSIVANNSGGDLSGTFAVNYSLIKNQAGAQISGDHNLFGADPQLGPLADHGGLTLTMLPAAGSPVINAGNPVNTLPYFNDQRGYPFWDFKDIGAVERQYPEDIVFRDAFDSY